ncbi:MAG: GGDEF domain-containing protein [Anaerolineales bacterium]|nr:MAG: GGDEF domain-containing protein [Anaerolineales bacterium]
MTTQDVETIFETIQAMVALVESDGTLVSWNSAFESWKGRLPSTASLNDLFSEKDKNVLQAKLTNKTAAHWAVQLPPDGAGHAVFYNCFLFPAQDGRTLFIAEQMETDITLQEIIQDLNGQVNIFHAKSESMRKLARSKQVELNAVIAQAKEVSQTDPLTFLLNRRAIIRELQDEVLRAERYNTPLSISLVDVDNFKAVNDTHGHPIGDQVLRQVAHQLREGVRTPDIVGRYGGEEFLILLPSSGITAAAEQASRLCKQAHKKVMHVKEHAVKITLSIGVAQFRPGKDTWETLLNRADHAMYKAKSSGRDRWVVAE